MNALKATVTKVLSQPRQITTDSDESYWLVDVECDCLCVGYEFET